MKLSTRIALRYLNSTHKGSFSSYASRLSMVGLSIGVASLIITVSIMNGFEKTVSEKIATFDSHVRLTHFMNRPISYPDLKLDSLFEASSYHSDVSAFIQYPALIRQKQFAEGVIVEGVSHIPSAFIQSKDRFSPSIELKENQIWLGEALAQQLSVSIGDKVVLADLQSIHKSSHNRKMKSFMVSGFFHSGLQEYDKTLVYISISAAQQLFNIQNKVSGYKINAKPQMVKELVTHIRENTKYPYYVVTWKEKHQTLFDWIQVQKWPILVNFGLIALVGVVNIISALAMIIIEKSNQVGILLSQGMRKKDIMNIFSLQGVFIGFSGALLGVVISFIVLWIQLKTHVFSLPENIYFIDHIPILISLKPILLISSITILFSFVSSFWPVKKISRIQPAKVLSYE